MEHDAFNRLKEMLCNDTVLAHYDPSLEIGITCGAAEVGFGVVLIRRYHDGGERPTVYASKTVAPIQQRYSHIQTEVLSIIFALRKFHQYLYWRKFIPITDHKPLLALLGPSKATLALAANILARWVLTLNQYDYSIEYSIEYRKATDRGNEDSLNRVLIGPNLNFDREEDGEDVDTVCMIKTISTQLNPTDPGILKKETAKDAVLSGVMRFTRERWPTNTDDNQGATEGYQIKDFKKLCTSLSVYNRCLLYGARIVISLSLQRQVLQILHLGHFGTQRMKQLA